MKKKPLDLTFGFRFSAIPGCLAIEATELLNPMPLGIVYYRLMRKNTQIDILDSHVHPNFRRRGIRSAINKQLIEWYPGVKEINSDGATKEGAAWMTAYGYVQRSDSTWTFRIKRRKTR